MSLTSEYVGDLEHRTFWLLVITVSLLFAWILWPFFGAILWSTLLAIVFDPVYRRLLGAMPKRTNLAALSTVLFILLIVILPLTLVTASVVQEASSLYQRYQSGELNLGQSLPQIRDVLPGWAVGLLDRFELTSTNVEETVSEGVKRGSQFFAAQLLNIGQTTIDFVISLCVTLYLLFFLLRDGDRLMYFIRRAVPLAPEHKVTLFDNFTVAIRATVKGDIVVALLQGALGGLIFWILGIGGPVLWGLVMTVLSFVPVFGTALVWVPAAVYLLVTGSVWEAIILVAYFTLVVGLVDNVVRPILVGQDMQLPSYVVLIATLGGISIFGVNGLVLGPVIAAIFVAAWEMVLSLRQGAKADQIGS